MREKEISLGNTLGLQLLHYTYWMLSRDHSQNSENMDLA